ncbi:BRD4 interacting chromatin remodeling complex associated protein isoform 2-T2 [Glossina fuscipes fuscipes]
MSRRQSLDRPGILSPPGPFLTPSPSPSISASPRLQPSPSLSPFPQDVLLVTGNPLTNASTHEQERKTVTPGRRQSIHQFTNGSPNAGTVVFQPSPSQSPAAATSVVGVTAGSINVITGLTSSGATTTTSTTGHELNATLVGSNNIQLNKKGTKRQQHQHLQHHQIFNNNSNNSNNSGHYNTNSATSAIAGGYGQLHASTINNTPHTFATGTVACSPKSQTKKCVPNGPANATATTAAVLSTNQQQTLQSQQSNFQQYHSNSPLIADSPSPSPSNTITAATIKPPTPQPMQMLQQQFTLSTNSPSNGPQQTFQLIQGPQGQIIAAATQQQQQRFANTNTATSNQNGKSTKVPQQILPKPNQPQFQSQIHLENISQLQQSLQPTTATQVHNPNQQHQKTKNSTNSSNNNNSNNNNSAINTSTNMSQHLPQISQSPQPTQQTTQQQILLPSGATASLTATQQPLLLNQVPVLVQQNTPQGVQLILRPPTPQLTATPSLVIQNTRPQPQLQAQQQPQQLLRILGTNGATMQLAAATPTFIVSSQANLIQQATNLQTIKTNPQTPAITQISGLHAALSAAAAANTQPRSQQFATTAATINGHLLGPSMAAQLQNLQLAAAAAANGSGITAQIQMPNGLNASTGPTLLSQLPAANFQQGTTSSLINLNQLNGTNIHQLAAAAAAAGATFQTPGVPTQSPAPTSGSNANAVSSNSSTSTDLFNGQSPAAGLTSLTQSPGPSSIAVTSEPMRQPASVLQSIPASPQQVSGAQIQLSLNAAATIQLQQQQQQQQQAQIQQLQQQIQQTQNQVQQAQKQVQLQQQQPPSEPTKKKPRPRKKKQPGTSSVQNAAASNPTAINSVNSTPTTAAVVKTFTATANRPLNTTTSSAIAIPTTITTSNSNVTVPNSITANATLTTVTTTNHSQPYGNATTVQQESQMQMNLLSNQIAQVQQQPAKSPSPPPQITRASNGKLDLGNVMKLCGIMEDDDDEDYSMEACGVSASSGEIAQHPDNGNNNAEISISLPQTENHSGTLPYTLTIPATSATAMTGESNVPGPATNIVIKIDAGDSGLSSSASGTAPYSISIPSLPTAEEINAQAQQMATMSQQIKPTLPHVPTSINFSLPLGQISSMTSTSFPTTGSIHNNIITSMAGRISTSTFSATNAVTATMPATVTATATTTTTTTTATVKPRRKPAAKRNNKKQETNNVNLIHTPSTSIALQNTSTSITSNINQTNSTTLASLNNSANSNTINAPLSTAALVPSHIGNIQISQIDANRLAQNTNNMLNTSLGTVVDNKIQIMPIIEKIAATTTTTTAQLPVQSQQQIVLQNSGMQAHNVATTGTTLGDNQTKQMHLVALPQTSNSGSSPAISISNSSTTFTTPTLSIPQQINHTPTNLTATIPTAAMTPVSSQLSGMAANVNLSVCSPATIAALLPQLTGSLTLAVSEQCERLILRHDPSQPPDEQSHTIRRALLTGAIANVTIINEPSKVEGINKIPLQIPTTPQPNISSASTSCSTTTTSTLGTVSKQTKKVTTQKQNVNTNNGDFSSSSKQALKKSPDLGSMTVGSANSSGLSQQQRYVALPKIDPNSQQLFCLNTLNNQITPISPNQTTASIAPTERLLIAPAGINAQQLAQCLQQGQIHFNDVNPPTAQNQPSTTMVTQSLNNQQPKQQIVHPLASSASSVPTITTSMNTIAGASATITSLTNQTNVAMTTATTVTTKQVANVAPIIDQSKAVKQDNKQNTLIGATNANTSTVQKKKPVRKPKASTTTAADVALMKNATVVKPLPKLDPLSQKPNNNPIQIVQPNTASGKPVTSNPCLTPTSTNVTNTTSTSNISNIASVPPFQTTQIANGTKLVGVTAPMQQQTQSNNMIQQQQQQNSLNMLRPQGSNGNVFGLGFSSISSISTTITSSTSSNSMNNINSSMQNGPPSLTSIQQNNINQSTGSSPSTTTPPQQQQQFQPQHTVSRVQTIQLTPQQQQMFRQVQMQIQYLTYKMQHKSMVSSLPLPPEFDANIIAPFNKAMSEIELNTSLQRLFVEQQSILASGKEIPTPEGFITNPGVTGSGPMNFTTLMQPPVLMDNSKSSITNSNATIPANVVQPNNHSNSPNNINASNNNNNNNNNNNATSSSASTSVQQTTQRIHIYPIQHNQHKAKQQKTTQQPPQQQLIPSSQSILTCSTANIINNNNASSNSLITTTSTMQQQTKTTNKSKPSQPIVTSMQQTQQLPPTQTPQLPHPAPPPLTAQSLQISLSPLLQSAQQQQMINISNMPAMLQQKHFTQHLQQQILQQQQQQQQKLQNAKSPATSLATLNSQNFNIGSSSVVGGPPPLIFPNSSIILAQQHHQPAQPLATSTPQLPQPQLPTLSTLPASFTASLTNQKPVIGGNSSIITSINSTSTSNSFPNSNSLTTATTLVTMPSLTASSTVVTTSSVTLMQISTSSSTSSFSTSTTSTAAITISSTAAITTPSTSASLTVTASPSIAVAATVSSHSSSGNTGINRFTNSIYVTSNNTSNNTSLYPDNGVGGTTTTTTTSACVPIIGLKTEDQTQMSPKQKLARLSLFLQQLEVDQRSCLKPDYKNPFQTKEETVKKLIRYHCFYQTDEDIPIEEEEEFERTAQRFQDKFRLLSGKFQEILLQESMLPHRTSELCQMEQLMIEDLRQEIEESRRLEKELKVYEQQQIEYIKNEPPAQYQNQSSSIGFEQVKNEPKPEPTENKSILDITVNGTDSNSNFTNHSQQSTSSSLVSESTFDSIKNEIKTESSNSQCSQSANKSSNSFLDSFDAQKAPGIVNIKQQQQQQQQQQHQSAPNQMPLTKAAKKEDIFNNWNQSFLESGKTSGNTYYSHLASSINSMPKPVYPLYNGALKKPLPSQEIKPPVKEEFENFDIESEITPSFIMKKVEPKASIKPLASPATEQQSPTVVPDEKTNCNSSKDTPEEEDRNSNYVPEQTSQNLIPCQKSLQVCSTQIATSNHFAFSNHVNTSNAQNSSCRQHDDDWLCIQKELNLMNNEVTNAPTKVTDVPTQHNTSNHQNRNDMVGPVTKELDFLTDSSPADLFPNGCINKGNENKNTTQASPPTNTTTTSSCSQQNQQPTAHHMTQSENHQTDLNEFFSGSEDSEIHKSVESRLEAMFSGSPVHISGSKSSSVDNSDDIESGLESIFGESVKSPAHCGNKHKTTTWDQDIGGNSYIGQPQPQQEQPQQPSAPASFMNAHHMQQQVNSANNARWMQNMEAQLSDFMSTNNTTNINSSSSDCLVAAGRKRSWNGHVMGNESSDMRTDENNAHKKLCTNVNGLTSGSSNSSSPLPQVSTHPPHNNSLPTDTSHAQDLMEAALLSLHDGLGVENTATDTATDANGFSHIMSHQNHFGSYNNHLNANGQQNHYVSTNVTHHNITPQDLNNHMLHINHHQSQHQANNHNNATGSGGEFDDDITRHVQNAIDSILNLQSTESDSLPFSLDHSMGSFLSDSILDDRQSTNGQSSCQELAKRRQLVDELTDCLMVNANGAPTSNVVDNAMLMDTSANHAQLMTHNNAHHGQAMHHSHHMNNNGTVAAVTTATAAAAAAAAAAINTQHNQINDFSCVVSGIDDAVKSIMSS